MNRTSVTRKAARLCAAVFILSICAGLVALSSPGAAATHAGPQSGGFPMHQMQPTGFHHADDLGTTSHGSSASTPRTGNFPQQQHSWPTTQSCFGAPGAASYFDSFDYGSSYDQGSLFGYSQSATAWTPFAAANVQSRDAMWWFGYTAGQMPGWSYPSFTAQAALGYCAAIDSLVP